MEDYNQFINDMNKPTVNQSKAWIKYVVIAVVLVLILASVILISAQWRKSSPVAQNVTPTPVEKIYMSNGQRMYPPKAALTPNGAPPHSGPFGTGYTKPAHFDNVITITPKPQRVSYALNNSSHVLGASTYALPASVDLSQNAPPVGDQGQVGSCAAWASDYSLRGYYAIRDGYYPTGGLHNTGGFAPMYTYAQVVHGVNTGTTPQQHFSVQQSQGVDTRQDYSQGDFDYTSQPSSSERANAANFKISSYGTIATGGQGAQQAIETSLSNGDPVEIAFPVYYNFERLNQSNYYYNGPTSGEPFMGGHAVTAFKYDDKGIWIENQWATGWGLNGWAELSWGFIQQYLYEADVITPIAPANITPGQPTATPTTSANQPTATPTPMNQQPSDTPLPTQPVCLGAPIQSGNP